MSPHDFIFDSVVIRFVLKVVVINAWWVVVINAWWILRIARAGVTKLLVAVSLLREVASPLTRVGVFVRGCFVTLAL